jgi:hypothetical protein
VSPEDTGSSEWLIALLTEIWPLPGVDAIMFLEVASCSAGEVTLLTGMWLLPAVGHLMSLEGTSLCAGIVAL